MKKYNQVRQYENSTLSPGKTKQKNLDFSTLSATERGRELSEIMFHLNLIFISVKVCSQTRHREFLTEKTQIVPCHQLTEVHFASPTDAGMCPMTCHFPCCSQKGKRQVQVLGLDEYRALNFLKNP